MPRFNALDPKDRLNQLDKMSDAEMAFARQEARHAARLVFDRHQGTIRPEFCKLIASYLTDLANDAVRSRQQKAGN